tara:strand:+ start:1034 stop:1921 length:888 start_codon:yes stop_codon:yes gene_type:complete
MTRISQGDALTTAMLQPGWNIATDGYGLYTGRCTFKMNRAEAISGLAAFVRGAAHPIAAFNFMTVHKIEVVYDLLGVATVTAEYIGVSVPDQNWTNPNVTGSMGLTSEPITSHPNFFTAAAGFPGASSPIAGLPVDFGGAYDDSTLGPMVTVISATTLLPVNVPSSEGYHGACFETGQGGRFIGFVDPADPHYYGKTSYLAQVTSFSGVLYFKSTEATKTAAFRAAVGTTSGSNTYCSSVKVLPDYIGTTFLNGSLDCMLLSQVNFEDYGNVYKCSYEIRYNPNGYPQGVYKNGE